jgi:hypothetical protein
MGMRDEDLKALHQEVIAAFTRIYPLLDGAGGIAGIWSKNPRGVKAELRSLDGHLTAVRDLELAMPIVAPMKAGKSSLINAIVGYQLLPSRVNPMTTLPTKIILVDGMDIDQPELEIPASLAQLCARVEVKIRDGVAAGQEIPEGHAYLSDLKTEIVSRKLPALKPVYGGVGDVHKVLARLNDEIRLATFVAPGFNLLDELDELPVLRTGSRHSYQAGDAVTGRLVIIDTPGPNEKAMAAPLSQVLETQLENSHVVIVMLDYTQIGAEAAADVRSRLQRHLAIIGDKLYAVVNKVDERKNRDDLNKEDTREIARTTLGMAPQQAADRVFETVAHWGVIGAQVLAELDQPGYDPAASVAARALWIEMNPLLDEEQEITEGLRATPPGMLEMSARKLLDRSGVAKLVADAISRLREIAAPAVIGAALDRYRTAVDEMLEVVALERSSAEQSTQVVQAQLAELEREIDELNRKRAAKPDRDQLRQRFGREIDALIDELRVGGARIVGTLDAKQPPDPGDQSLPAEILTMVTSTYGQVKKRVWHDGAPQKSQTFSSRTEAEAFMDRMHDNVVSSLNKLLEHGRAEANRRIKALADALATEQQNQVHELLERAAKQLADTFQVELKVPDVAVASSVDIILDQPETHTSSGSYQTTKTVQKRTWRTLWTEKEDVKVPTTGYYSSTSYVVKVPDVQLRMSQTFESRLGEISQGLGDYVTDELDARLTAYYDGVDHYLQRYHGALSRSQAMQHKDDQERKRRVTELTLLEGQLTVESAALAGHRAQLP